MYASLLQNEKCGATKKEHKTRLRNERVRKNDLYKQTKQQGNIGKPSKYSKRFVILHHAEVPSKSLITWFLCKTEIEALANNREFLNKEPKIHFDANSA